jgi:hypothetical protein
MTFQQGKRSYSRSSRASRRLILAKISFLVDEWTRDLGLISQTFLIFSVFLFFTRIPPFTRQLFTHGLIIIFYIIPEK